MKLEKQTKQKKQKQKWYAASRHWNSWRWRRQSL